MIDFGILLLFVMIFVLFIAVYVKQIGYEEQLSKNIKISEKNSLLEKDLNQAKELLNSKFEETLQLATTDQLIYQIMTRKKAIVLVVPETNDLLFSNVPPSFMEGNLVKIHHNISRTQFKMLITNMASSMDDDNENDSF